MVTIKTKRNPNKERDLTLVINDKPIGKVYAVYRTKTQFYWEGNVSIKLNDSRLFVYSITNADSSRAFIREVIEKLGDREISSEYNESAPVIKKSQRVISGPAKVVFQNNEEGKAIPMSDLVNTIKNPINVDKFSGGLRLKDFDDTEKNHGYLGTI